jgi:hypothetical protein
VDLFDSLQKIAADLAEWYPGFVFVLVGYHSSGDAHGQVRIPCAGPKQIPRPPEDGSNADLVMTVLGEADRPLTVVEIGFKATGAEPTGALRRALARLLRDGVVRELPGPPKTYEAV